MDHGSSLPKIFNNPEEEQLTTTIKSVIKEKFIKMISDKKDTPSLVIPKNFDQFIKTQLFFNFVLSIYSYTKQYTKIQKKYKAIENRMMNRTGRKKQEPLEYQKIRLEAHEREISYYYSTILLKHSSRVVNNDQLFFEAILYLVSKVIKQFFSKDDYPEIEEQINRLFRTQKYNIIQKRHENDHLIKKYPILKQPSNSKMTIDNHLYKIMKKKYVLSSIRNEKKSRIFEERAKSFNRQNNVDVDQRSPLVSVWLGSNKHRMNSFVSDNHGMGVLRQNNDTVQILVKRSLKDMTI